MTTLYFTTESRAYNENLRDFTEWRRTGHHATRDDAEKHIARQSRYEQHRIVESKVIWTSFEEDVSKTRLPTQ